MGKACCVYGCYCNQNDGTHISLYEFPRVKRRGRLSEAIEKRRNAWMTRVGAHHPRWEKKSTLKNLFICSLHFVGGKPINIENIDHVDWVPSMKLVPSQLMKLISTREETEDVQESEIAPGQIDNIEPNEFMDCESQQSDLDNQEPSSSSDFDSQEPSSSSDEIDELASVLQKLRVTEDKVKELQQENKALQEEVTSKTEKIELLEQEAEDDPFIKSLEKDDVKTSFYTGIDSYEKLWMIFTWLSAFIPKGDSVKVPYFNSFVMILMRLRLHLTVEDLSYRFHISKALASRKITFWIHAMYVCLVPALIFWPTREYFRDTIPLCFRDRFQNCVCIIDCFEIFLERPIKIKERASTYSNYKSHNTVKYLIGITPQGSVSFISKGYGGRCSDKFIVEDSGILDHLIHGDLVLADKGFTVHEAVALTFARLEIPAFLSKNKNMQLTRLEVENSRALAKVRIHVERLIGAIKQRFSILRGTLHYSVLKSDEENIATIDKMVHVACALYNANESVVPMF